MGQTISNTMKENQKEMQKEMQRKQLELMLKQRQTQLAVQFASGKEFFHWYASFYAIIFPICIIGAIKRRIHYLQQSQFLQDLFLHTNMICFTGTQLHLFSDKMRRIKIEAERLIEEKPQLFYFPRNANIVSQDEYESILQIQKKPN